MSILTSLPRRPSSFAPSDLTNLRLWLDAFAPENTLYQENTGGGTTPAVATNNPVGTVRDKSTQALNFAAIASGQRATLSMVEAKGRMNFDGVDDGYTGPIVVNANGACTLAFSWRLQAIPASDGAVSLLVLKTGANSWIELVVINPVAALAGYRSLTMGCDITTSPANAVGASVALDTGIHRAVLTYNGLGTANPANYTLLYDGSPVTVIASGSFNKTASDLSSVGARWNGTTTTVPSALVFDCLAVWSGVKTGPEIARIDGWLFNHWKRSYVIIIEGDSIARGFGIAAGSRWSDLLKATYGDAVEVVNVAVDGQTTPEAIAAATGRVNGLMLSATVKCELKLKVGTNDLSTTGRQVNGGDPTTLFNNTVTYFTARKAFALANGINLATTCFGILPRSDGNCVGGGSAHEVRRAAYHALITGTPPADFMSRDDLLTGLGAFGDQLTANYSDQVHISAAGAVILAGTPLAINTARYTSKLALGFLSNRFDKDKPA